MEIFFSSDRDALLYTKELGGEQYPRIVVENFFYHLDAIQAANSEADLLMLRSLPLKFSNGSYLIALNEAWVLALKITTKNSREIVEIKLVKVLIEEHHE